MPHRLSLSTKLHLWLTAYALIFLSGCAQIVAPTGGPKDVTPAKVVKAYPPNQSIRFKEKKIVLEFDEFILLNNPAQQIVISPPLNENPVFELKGKKLQILFRENLKANTTYTINFGNAITDVHEGNITTGFTYAFSTGEYIDSLSAKGTCKNAYNLTAEKDLLVALYNNQRFNDSTIFTQKPDYFGVTNENGEFLIQNLPDSFYRIFVFKDDNKNLKYDPNEVIGFDTAVYRTSDTANRQINLRYYTPDVFRKNQLIDTINKYSGVTAFVFYKPQGIFIQHTSAEKSYTIYKTGKNNIDTLYCFIADTSLPVNYKVQTPDTTYNVTLRKPVGKPIYPFAMDMMRKVELGDTFWISFSVPIKIADTTRIVLKEDTIPTKYNFGFNKEKNSFYIKVNWKEGQSYRIEIADSAFTDIYQRYSNQQQHRWLTKTEKDYATLFLDIKNVPSNGQYILQLWNENESDLYKEFIIGEDKTITLDNQLPNKYKLKIIEDKNGNGKWDNGSLKDYILPEMVFYTKELVVLRAYWDSEQIIDLSELLK